MAKARIGKWLWRFAAVVMLFAVGWSVWIFYQLNPSALITSAAYEAAAKAHAKQSSQGVIGPPATPETPREPPINTDKLKFSDTLSDKK